MSWKTVELDHNLLETIISEEFLNNLLENTRCPQILNSLLQIKRHRIQNQRCKKINISIDCIYNPNTRDVDLATNILKNTLFVALDPNPHILKAIEYCFDNLQVIDEIDNALFALNLLNVVFEHYYPQNRRFFEFDANKFHNIVLTILNDCSHDLNQFAMNYLVPNYLKVIDKKQRNDLLKKIFESVNSTKKTEILCAMFEEFVVDLSNGFNLFACDDFWRLLMNCLVDQLSFGKKHAIWLLNQSIAVIFKNNLTGISQYMKQESVENDLNVWLNYFVLLDVSNEKQLHLIQPALKLLDSIKVLHTEWRLCLYRIFLKHSQKIVCYRVALFVLQNESHNSNKMMKEILIAINKNEYNSDSRRVFQEILIFASKLTENEFEELLNTSLEVAWVPAAIWCFYNKIFVETISFQFSVSLLEKIISNLKTVPHVFIRDACRNLVFNYYTRVCVSFKSFDEFLKIADLLINFNESALCRFIKLNQKYLVENLDNLNEKLIKCLHSKSVEIISIILNTVESQCVKLPKLTNFNRNIDLVCFNLFQKYDPIVLKNYIINRIESLGNNEEVLTLVKLGRKLDDEKTLDYAFTILLNPSNYNNAQKTLSFALISSKSNDKCVRVIQAWKTSILKTDSEEILQFFVETLARNFNETLIPIEQIIDILDNIMDRQNSALVTVLENISLVLNHSSSHFEFIKRCLSEFLLLVKSGASKKFSETFLTQIFNSKLLTNAQYFEILAVFCSELINMSNNTTISCLVSENIANLCHKYPKSGVVFVPVIIEFILFGIKMNKNERVEYSVCQEIMHRLSITQDNPNFEDVLVRLWAFDSMLSLVKTENLANVFASLLIDKYMIHFNKRYFPDSDIHIQKLRIIQALILLHQDVTTEKLQLVNVTISSFLLESHQPSVKHLMQWFLILLLDGNTKLFLECIGDKLKSVDNNRPSTISAIIPVFYHLANDTEIEKIMEIFLPYTMGPQFKLRIFSQVALLKLHQKTETTREKHEFLYKALTEVVEASNTSLFDTETIKREFLEYFSVKTCDHSTLFYTIPKINGVGVSEWENLYISTFYNQFKNLKFNKICDNPPEIDLLDDAPLINSIVENLQKKITPWKYNMDTSPDSNNFILVTSLIEKPANLGGLSRTCEIFGIKQMVVRTGTITNDKEFKSLSMSSENWVEFLEVKLDDLTQFFFECKRKGYTVIGAEQTAQSKKLGQFQFPKLTVLVLGNEKVGIAPNITPFVDQCVEIPQFGLVRSLNVHVAGAVMIWEYCKQHKL